MNRTSRKPYSGPKPCEKAEGIFCFSKSGGPRSQLRENFCITKGPTKVCSSIGLKTP